MKEGKYEIADSQLLVYPREKFNERLYSHRKECFAVKKYVCTSERFFDAFNALSDDEKERAGMVMTMLQNSKIPELYGTIIEEPDAYFVDMCGLVIVYSYNEAADTLSFYDITNGGKSGKYTLSLLHNADLGDATREYVEMREDLITAAKRILPERGFESIVALSAFRKKKRV